MVGSFAFAYEIKVHDELITEDNWEIAELLPNPPTPLPSGSQQNYSYLEGEPGTVYFFAIKVLDDVLNVSPLSNVINSTLLEDTTPPADCDILVEEDPRQGGTGSPPGGGGGDHPRLQEQRPPELPKVVDEKRDRNECDEAGKYRERQLGVRGHWPIVS